MIQLELGGERWPLATGETVIGSSPAAAVRLEHAGVLPRHALVHAAAAGAAIRRAEDDAVVSVNGVRLGTDPVPLLHGDKIQVGVVELAVVDERKAGATRMADATSVTLDVGVNFIANIVNCKAEELKVGMKVKPHWHPLDDGTHLLMFQPDKDAA